MSESQTLEVVIKGNKLINRPPFVGSIRPPTLTSLDI